MELSLLFLTWTAGWRVDRYPIVDRCKQFRFRVKGRSKSSKWGVWGWGGGGGGEGEEEKYYTSDQRNCRKEMQTKLIIK